MFILNSESPDFVYFSQLMFVERSFLSHTLIKKTATIELNNHPTYQYVLHPQLYMYWCCLYFFQQLPAFFGPRVPHTTLTFSFVILGYTTHDTLPSFNSSRHYRNGSSSNYSPHATSMRPTTTQNGSHNTNSSKDSRHELHVVSWALEGNGRGSEVLEPEPSNQQGISKTIIMKFLHIRDVPWSIWSVWGVSLLKNNQISIIEQ